MGEEEEAKEAKEKGRRRQGISEEEREGRDRLLTADRGEGVLRMTEELSGGKGGKVGDREREVS